MSVGKTPEDFRFESTLLATLLPKCFGLMLIWVSIGGLKVWLHPSWDRLPYMVLLIPFHVFLWLAGGTFLLGTCYIQIVDGQLRIRRFFVWESVPLASIASMRAYRYGIYLRLDHAGKRYRVIFAADNLRLGPSPPPVIQFLRELYSKNAGEREPRP